MKKALLALLVLLISSLGVVQAQTPNVPGAAVPVDQSTSTGNNPIVVTRLFTAVRNRVDWFSCLSFKNNTQQNITAIQFRFTYIDAFDTPINSFRADRVGDFAPGVLVEGPENADIVGGGNITQKSANCWEVPQIVGSLSKVTVEVQKVRFTTGTIWNAPNDHPVFTANYMGSGSAGDIDHPATVRCQAGMLVVNSDWNRLTVLGGTDERGAPKNKIARTCLERWYHDHDMTAPWERPSPSPMTTVLPSPMPTTSP